HLNQAPSLYVTERSVGAHPTHNLSVRLVTPSASHALFSYYMFRDKVRDFAPQDFVILHVPGLELSPQEFATKSETCVATYFERKIVTIGRTFSAAEIITSFFSLMNLLLHPLGILPLPAGAKTGQGIPDVAVLSGLSGTGKTTLSTDEGKL